jgi:hypothetical protein
MRKQSFSWPLLVAALCLSHGAVAGADDTLEAARRLYAAAAYEDALRALDRAQPSPSDPASTVAVLHQRLLCFVALGRTSDAEQAIRAIVQVDPLYVPDPATAPPRVRAAFQDQRARLVPVIAKTEYERARAAFEAGDHAAASAGFARVLAIVESSPDGGTDPMLRDVAVLATGFRTLSDKAAAPAAAAAAPPEPPPVAPVVPTRRVYDATVARVAAPAVIRQEIPQWPRHLGPPPRRNGVLELIINEEGTVESARIAQAVHPGYDHLVLVAASSWSYRPARLDGAPVRFRKLLRLTFK